MKTCAFRGLFGKNNVLEQLFFCVKDRPDPSPILPGMFLVTHPKRPTPPPPLPCVKRPFEWEIHGSANLAFFCCVLRVTWCHHVRFLCYLRHNGGTINVSKFEVVTSRLFSTYPVVVG